MSRSEMNPQPSFDAFKRRIEEVSNIKEKEFECFETHA
jgi:hypothetical protein